MKTDLFQSCDHCWVFQICWHIECSTFTASSFRIWNSSAGIPLPPLALFVVMLPKAHLTSHSRMSGSRWVGVITPSWLSGSWRSFLYSSLVYSCHLFLISSASVRSIPFLPFIELIFAWMGFIEPISAVAQWCPTLCYPWTVHGIFLTRILEWAVIRKLLSLILQDAFSSCWFPLLCRNFEVWCSLTCNICFCFFCYWCQI